MKNVKENKETKTFTVQTSDGKTKVYKRKKAAYVYAAKKLVSVDSPMIVTANANLWSPQRSASGRRSTAKKRRSEIANFSREFDKIPTILVRGNYSESCHDVYKIMVYKIDRRKGNGFEVTNFTGLKGEAARWGITLI